MIETCRALCACGVYMVPEPEQPKESRAAEFGKHLPKIQKKIAKTSRTIPVSKK
jgi:hypothetical protein